MNTREMAEQIVDDNTDTTGRVYPARMASAIDGAIKQAIADERERAAGICEGLVTFDADHEKYMPVHAGDPCGWCDGLEKAAAAIRRDSTGEEGR